KASVRVSALQRPTFCPITSSSSFLSLFPCLETISDRQAASAARLSILHPVILASLGVRVPFSLTKYLDSSSPSGPGLYSLRTCDSTFLTSRSRSFKLTSSCVNTFRYSLPRPVFSSHDLAPGTLPLLKKRRCAARLIRSG